MDDGYFSCCLRCRISFSLPPLFFFCISWAFEIFFFISKLPKASTIHLPLSSPHPSISSFFILSYLSHYLIPSCWFHSPLLVFSLTSSQIPCLCLPLCRLPPLSRQHPGYSSITNAQDLWVTAARLYCHNMIVLYMRETHTPACTHAHVSFDVHAGLLEHAPLLLPK